MTQYLMIFAVLFIPLIAVIVLIQRMQGNTMGRLSEGLKAKGWSEAVNSSFICPPFLKDYKSIVHNELHKENAVVQIVEHRMAFKIYLDTVSFSCKLTATDSSSHIFFLDKKMGPPRNTDGLSVANVAAPNISNKYVVYVGSGTSESLLNKIAQLVEPLCADLPYTCIELDGSVLYVSVGTHAIKGDKVGIISDHFSNLAQALNTTS